MPSENHCEHCEQTEILEKDVRALFGKTNQLSVDVALSRQTGEHVQSGLAEMKTHLNNQDTKLDDLKSTISRWGGAIAVIVAIPGVFAIIWSVTHGGK